MPNVAELLPEIEQKVMSGLKDFQRETVQRIDSLYRSGQMRVLVSDEVGLGKTLIARGTVAKVARMQKDKYNDNLVKVVYICSNGAIADQNLRKLQLTEQVRREGVGYSRLSMQHLNIAMQESDEELLSSYIQLIPLTPDTSFRMTSGSGMVSERALMFALLRRLPELVSDEAALEVAMTGNATSAWNGWARKWYDDQVIACDEMSGHKYIDRMLDALREELQVPLEKNGDPAVTLLSSVKSMCERIRRDNFENKGGNGYIIGKLRLAFAKISLEQLEPDLVIMDEFQRFKYLLSADPESDTGLLANKFFNSENVRMLLLSATPYKMYSTLEEIDESQVDEHYSEFLKVMKFLNVTEEDDEKFREIWSNYSVQLKELSEGTTTILAAKQAAEDALYQRICRTERLSAVENADIIDDSDVAVPVEVLEQDIRSYVQAQKLLDSIEAPFSVPVDYIKSTPYLMSFMRDYQLKRYVERYFKQHPDEVGKLKDKSLWLDRRAIDRFEPIPMGNARLERVIDRVMQNKAELLLWVPPAKPYYEFQGVYNGSKGFTKTLIFSSWEMVPRMVASMVSYQAERKTVGKLAKGVEDRTVHYFASEDKRYPAARLNFAVSRERLNGMYLFCLLYPSRTLADCYDPVHSLNEGLTLEQIEQQIREKLAAELGRFENPSIGNEDRRWYYLAPMLLDGETHAAEWLGSENQIAAYDLDDEKTQRQKGFLSHMNALRELYTSVLHGETCLGRMPADLLEVLSTMAIASPAICVLRTYRHYQSEARRCESYLPSQIARIFINRLNTVEATAAVELACGKKSDDAHWRNVLTYCKQGNFQAMFDEYAHLLVTGIGRDDQLIYHLHRSIAEAMDFRTTVYDVDTYDAFVARTNGTKERGSGIRSHFAVAFTKGDGKEKDTDRKKSVRDAFNSPFRPFVLASTSIGQEGLDFHNYCRRIVHWNLPSNPIDLEQREGRINRFECHAIRQNVAQRYGDIQFRSDIWEELFEKAKEVERTDGCSELIPFWGLKETPDMVKIERIVPMYPFSRDELAYERLIKILSLYRLTLGQPRQEELLEYIFRNCEEPEELKKMFINLSPFYRENKA